MKNNSLSDIIAAIKSEALAAAQDMTSWRRHLHAHPELSFKEHETTRFVVEQLKSFGYADTDITVGFGPLETGVTAYVGRKPSDDVKVPCVALRADMDALPICEKTDVEYKSVNDGVMHACGHDMHTAGMLGTAKILKTLENKLPGRVKLIFQPAEETRIKIFEKPLSGAGYVVRSGALEDVDAVFGMHVWGTFEGGRFFVRNGPTMMASARFNLKVVGKGTHGASPHLGCDPITTACQIVNDLQTVVSRETSPIEPALITIGTIHGGTATNIVPQEVLLSGTIRAAEESVVRFMGERLGEVAELTARAHRCTTEYDLLINGPAVVNNPVMADVVRRAAAHIVGAERVAEVDMLTGSEDFREYSSRRPSALYFLGMRNPDKGIGQPQHDPAFVSDDSLLADQAAVMACVAFEYFASIETQTA